MSIISRLVPAIPILIFFLVAVLPTILRGGRNIATPSKEMQKRAKRIDRDYEEGPLKDRAKAKPQGRYANIPRPTFAERLGAEDSVGPEAEWRVQTNYVSESEPDWSFEADNKPRKTPIGFDR